MKVQRLLVPSRKKWFVSREKTESLEFRILQSVRFGHAKFPDGGLALGSCQFSILPQLPLKMMLGLEGHNRLENNHLASLILIRDTL